MHFGVKTFEGKKTGRMLLARLERYMDGLFEAHQPNVLAIEEVFYAQARLSPLLRELVTTLKRWGRRKGLRIAGYLPTTVKDSFCAGKKTRKALAEAMVHRYGFLSTFLKQNRTQSARLYWQQMFDAVALGVIATTDARNSSMARLARAR